MGNCYILFQLLIHSQVNNYVSIIILWQVKSIQREQLHCATHTRTNVAELVQLSLTVLSGMIQASANASQMIPCKLEAQPAAQCSILDFILFEYAAFSLHVWCSGHKQPQEGRLFARQIQIRFYFMGESFPDLLIQLKIYLQTSSGACWPAQEMNRQGVWRNFQLA